MAELTESPAQSTSPPKKSRGNLIGLILPLLNIVAISGTIGFAVYSKMIYKRATIHETGERERLEKLHSTPSEATQTAFIKLGPMTVNIAPTPSRPGAASGTQNQLKGKLHYVTVSMALEIRDQTQTDLMEAIRPRFLDTINQLLGKLPYHTLVSAQGRYIAQSKLIDEANRLVAQVSPDKGPDLVTHLYFTEFVVQ